MSEKLEVVPDWDGGAPFHRVEEAGVLVAKVFGGDEDYAHLFAGAKRLKEAADRFAREWDDLSDDTLMPRRFGEACVAVEHAAKSCEPPEATDVDT